MRPRKPDSRANSGVISGKPIGVIESTSISPSSIRYRAPTLTWGRVQFRTLQVISPRRTPSRSRLVNVMMRVYEPILKQKDDHGLDSKESSTGPDHHRANQCRNAWPWFRCGSALYRSRDSGYADQGMIETRIRP